MTPKIHTLSNGVRVISDPIGGLESLALSIVIDGGSRWETEATAGWAHLLEHMVFKGAGERSSRAIVEAIEGEGGNINAATGQERTSFQVRCLKGGLPLGLDVLTDLIRRPTLDAADLEKEKGVVGQEIAEAADTPDDRVFELAQARAYAGHSAGPSDPRRGGESGARHPRRARRIPHRSLRRRTHRHLGGGGGA